MMTRLLETASIVVLLIAFSASTALPQDIIWSNNFGGQYNEKGYACQQTTDGGLAIVGSTYQSDLTDHDIYLLKLDSLGNRVYSQTFGGSSTDYGYDIRETSDGGLVLVGSTKSYGSGGRDIYLIKTDANGNHLWSKYIGGTGDDEGRSVRTTNDGGLIICGSTTSSGAGYNDLYLVKTDANGNTLFSRTYGGIGGDAGAAVRQTPDSGFVMIGSTGSFGTGYSSIYVVRTDSNGDSLWATTYGGTRADFGSSLEVTADGGFAFVGSTSSFGLGYSDLYLIRTDPSGNVEWQQTYGGTSDDRGYSVNETGDGGFIVAGTTESFGLGINAYLVRTNPIGVQQWDNYYGGVGSDYCQAVLQDAQLDFYLVGYSYSYSSGGSDVYVVKVQGDVQTDVQDRVSEEIPDGFELAQNYPNPFNISTTIQYSIPTRNDVSLTIFNMLGQRVRQWRFDALPAGTYALEWNGHNEAGSVVSTGVYFYRVVSGTHSLNRKMVLLK